MSPQKRTVTKIQTAQRNKNQGYGKCSNKCQTQIRFKYIRTFKIRISKKKNADQT